MRQCPVCLRYTVVGDDEQAMCVAQDCDYRVGTEEEDDNAE